MADLSETAVVLPDRPGPVEVSAFLGLVGGMSAMVGVPATGLTVARPSQLAQYADRDLIVLGTLGRQPALTELLRETPLSVDAGGRLAMALPGALEGFARLALPGPAPEERVRAAAALAAPAEGLGFVAGAQSPLRPGRSVLALAAPTPAGLEAIAEALRDPARIPRFQGDLVVQTASGLQAFRTAPSYTIGTLPVWMWPDHYLGERPWMLLTLMLAGGVLVGLPVFALLRRRATRRLRGHAR
jgi:cellulose synthase (UDP-forming)